MPHQEGVEDVQKVVWYGPMGGGPGEPEDRGCGGPQTRNMEITPLVRSVQTKSFDV